jgi:hypothetical protein
MPDFGEPINEVEPLRLAGCHCLKEGNFVTRAGLAQSFPAVGVCALMCARLKKAWT